MIRNRHIAAAVTGLCLFSAGKAAGSEIVITEVLSDPVSESKGEFVELHNTGDVPIDLEGWSLGDPRDVNDTITDFTGPHDIGLAGTVLEPGAYAVVVDPDYDGAYGDRIVAGGDPARLLMLTIKEDRTLGNGLGNSKDLVFIKKDDFTMDQFEWTESAGGNGVSWERMRFDLPADEPNLSPSMHPDGSTPGFRNSTASDPPETPGPEEPDEPMEPAGPEEPETPEEPTQPEEPTEPEDPEEPMQPEEPVEPQEPALPPTTQEPTGNVFINEIMFNPGPNRSEWIELYNGGSNEIDLAGWSLRLDHVERARIISTGGVSIEGGGYLVIAHDLLQFRETHPAFDGRVVEAQGGWERLRNSGARVLLMDSGGSLIHDATYDEDSNPEPGRSVELVNPEFDPPVWGPSAAAPGGTPGQRNSLYVTRIPDGVTLHLNNNPSSPDGDNHEDICLVTVDLPASHGILHAMVFDISGRFIKTLMDQTAVASRHVFSWDGTDQHGRRLPVGPYILYVEQMLPTLNRLTASKHLVVIASSP